MRFGQFRAKKRFDAFSYAYIIGVHHKPPHMRRYSMRPMRRSDEYLKCYFNAEHICIGTIDDFYGDYFANEYYRLPFTINPVGMCRCGLERAEHEFNMGRMAFDLKEEEEADIRANEQHTAWQEAQIRANYPNIL